MAVPELVKVPMQLRVGLGIQLPVQALKLAIPQHELTRSSQLRAHIHGQYTRGKDAPPAFLTGTSLAISYWGFPG
jgi:hypothetical protein